MKNQIKIKLALILIAPAFMVACGSMGVRDIKKDEVAKIKSAAVVGITIEQAASSSISLDAGKVSGEAGGSIIGKQESYAEDLFVTLSENLKRNLGWKMSDTKSLVNQPGYLKAYKSTMEGWQNKMPVASGYFRVTAKSVMDADAIRILKPEGREILMKELKVDALVVAVINLSNEIPTLGIGSHYPYATVSFQVYSRGQENPIWFDGQVLGEKSKVSSGKTAFFDESILVREGAMSAKDAFTKIKF